MPSSFPPLKSLSGASCPSLLYFCLGCASPLSSTTFYQNPGALDYTSQLSRSSLLLVNFQCKSCQCQEFRNFCFPPLVSQISSFASKENQETLRTKHCLVNSVNEIELKDSQEMADNLPVKPAFTVFIAPEQFPFSIFAGSAGHPPAFVIYFLFPILLVTSSKRFDFPRPTSALP